MKLGGVAPKPPVLQNMTRSLRPVHVQGLYLLLVTNKQSNILEDLETLRLLGKLVPEISQSLEEEAVTSKAFELIFAFDEVISLGYKENITIHQVKQNCEMESHEEKLHKLIIQSKINDTKDIMKKKAADIEKSKMEQKKIGLGTALSGFGSKAAASLLSDAEPSPPAYREPVTVASSSGASKPSALASKGPSKGMQLGKAKKANDFLESLAKEGEVVELEVPKPAGGVTAVTVNAAAEPVSLAIEEKLSVALNKQGGVENLDVQVCHQCWCRHYGAGQRLLPRTPFSFVGRCCDAANLSSAACCVCSASPSSAGVHCVDGLRLLSCLASRTGHYVPRGQLGRGRLHPHRRHKRSQQGLPVQDAPQH